MISQHVSRAWLKPGAGALLGTLLATVIFPMTVAATELLARPCDQEQFLRSIEGTTLTSIRFINHTSQPVQIYWLNYDNPSSLSERQCYGALQGFETRP